MALKLGSLFFDVFADTSKLKDGMGDVEKQTGKAERSFSKLGTVIKAVVAAESARRILMIADNMRVLDTRLKNLTKTQAEYERSSASLNQTANDTGQTFKDTVVFFERATRALEDLGATNPQVLQFTDTIQKLGVLGGNSVDEIANGTRQLNQALQGGIVRAEEFNSIVENTPMIANAIAESLGKTTGELRNMVLAGSLTSDKVFSAILEQTESVNNEFKDFPRSITQASNALLNEFGQALKTIDSEAGGLTNFVTSVVDRLALGIKTINASLRDTEFDRVSDEISTLQDETQDLINTLERRQEFGLPKWMEGLFGSDETNEKVRQQIDANREKIAELLETQKELAGIQDKKAAGGDTGTPDAFVGPMGESEEVKSFKADQLQDEFLAIEMAHLEHQKKLHEITAEGTQERKDLEESLNAQTQAMYLEAAANRVAILQTGLSQVAGFMDSLNTLLEKSGNKNKAIMKAAFLAQKAVQVASIVASAYEAGAKVTAARAFLGPSAVGIGKAVTAVGLANAGIVAGLSVGEAVGGRQQGGPVSANSLYDVTENGEAEMFVSGNKQFLMTGSKGGKVISNANMQGGGGGSANVTVVNNTGVQASARTEYISRDELRIILDAQEQKTIQNAQSAIATGIDQNSGPVNESLNRNTQTIRRLS